MNKVNKFAVISKGSDKAMSAKEFVQKYAKGFDFVTYSKELRTSETNDFITFFDCMKSGLKMVDRNSYGVDRGGKEYRFYNFIKARALTGVKIFPFGKWNEFIADYQNGEIRIGFTASELSDELTNS